MARSVPKLELGNQVRLAGSVPKLALGKQKEDAAPVQAMRLAGMAGFMFSPVVLTSARVLGTW